MSAAQDSLFQAVCDPMARVAAGVELVAEASLPSEHGEYRILGYRSTIDGEELVALVHGDVADADAPLVRIHSQCLTGDVFGSLRCDCGRQLDAALGEIVRAGAGVIVYQHQEGRGIGIVNKIRAYALQDRGLDTVEANVELGFAPDERSYEKCAGILRMLGLRRVRVMSNNPEKIHAIEQAGIEVVERVSLAIETDERFAAYLRTKREKMGHLIEI